MTGRGQDDAGGSGIAFYNVYVSDNGGPYTPFLTDTTATSATFTGTIGDTYGFYSVATDNVGNVQPTPGAAQATTKLVPALPTSSVASLPTFSPTTFTLNWSGSDAGGPGIATYTIYVTDNGGASYTQFLTNTTQTSAPFTGAEGTTYGFYSVATDTAGNAQPTPSGAQATTTVPNPPTSSVASLPAVTSTTTFTLNWSGSDTGGPGIASYTIYVTDNGGTSYTPFLSNTTQTSASFTGQNGVTYGFYSVATDAVGIAQPTPSGVQATTTVAIPDYAAVLKTDGELDLFNQQSGAVTTISPAGTIASMTAALNSAGQAVVFVTVLDLDAQGNPHTLWSYNTAGNAWSEMSTGLFEQIRGATTPSGVPVLYGVVAGGSLWVNNPANGTGLNQGWTELSSGSFQSISPVSTPAGVLTYAIVAGGTLWEQNPANGTGLNQGWTELSSGSFQSISPVSTPAGVLTYAIVAGGSLWEQNPANGTGLNQGWTELSSGSFQSISPVSTPAGVVVYAIVAGGTLWEQNPANGTGLNQGWTEISVGSFAQIAATESAAGADLVFATLSDGEFWDYNIALLPADPWSPVLQNGLPMEGVASSSVA